MGEFEKFEKYMKYYSLCDEGRSSLLEAARAICADEKILSEALEIKNRLADPSMDFKPDEEFKGKSAQFGAFVYTIAIEDMEKLHNEKNVPRDVFMDTVNDLGVWIYRHYEWFGEWGFSQYGWLIYHIRGKVYKLGRLQFEPSNLSARDLPSEKFNMGLEAGDPILCVHVQSGGGLTRSACLASFEWAKKFFPDVLNYNFKAFACFTWLFDPALEKLLPSDSNIVGFQKLFTITRTWENYDGFERVFTNIKRENLKDAPTDTRLRKKLAEHLLAGGIMQSGAGFRSICN